MSEGHTPGPWEVAPYGLAVNARGEERMKICDIRGWGHLTGTGGGRGLSEDVAIAIQTANAHLIAAAPDLLAALKALLSFDDVTRANDRGPADEGWQSTELQHAFGAAEAAIAKAEGKDQR